MITWHEAKRRANLKKHGIDLAALESAFDADRKETQDYFEIL